MLTAKQFAFKAHKNQKYGVHPYSKHLSDVVEIIIRFHPEFRDDSSVIQAAWLHDSIEDVGVTREQIANLFGDRVSELVWRVSNEQGKNRKERAEKTYPKIAADSEATLIKLADRIANVESSKSDPDGLFKMYNKEYWFFRQSLYKENQHKAMWEHLNEIFIEPK